MPEIDQISPKRTLQIYSFVLIMSMDCFKRWLCTSSKKVKKPHIFDIPNQVICHWMSFLDLNSHTRFRNTCWKANAILDPRSFPPLIEIIVHVVQGCCVHPGLFRLLQVAISAKWTKGVTIRAAAKVLSEACWWPHLSLIVPVHIPTLSIQSPEKRNGMPTRVFDELKIEAPLGIVPDTLITFGTVNYSDNVVSACHLETMDTIERYLPKSTLPKVKHLTVRNWSTEGKNVFVAIHADPLDRTWYRRARIQDNFRNIETLTIKQTDNIVHDVDSDLVRVIGDFKYLKTIKIETSYITALFARKLFAMCKSDKNKIDVQMDEKTVKIARWSPSAFLQHQARRKKEDNEFMTQLQEENEALQLRFNELRRVV